MANKELAARRVLESVLGFEFLLELDMQILQMDQLHRSMTADGRPFQASASA